MSTGSRTTSNADAIPPATEVRGRDLRALLASDFAERQLGSRLPTVRDYSARFGASVGSVQAAVASLVLGGAVQVAGRRRSGTTLIARDLGTLWSTARGGPLIIAFPLPLTPRLQGLATAVRAALEEAGIETYDVFSRGSRRRLRSLHADRCHAVVLSTLGIEYACGPDEHVAVQLAIGSLAEEHRIFIRKGAPAASGRLRVAIDRDSADLQRLTELQFTGKDVDFVPASYVAFAGLMRDGFVDAAVWDINEVPAGLPADVTSEPIDEWLRPTLEEASQAAIVTKATDGLTEAVVRNFVRIEAVAATQDDVLAGRRVPEY